MAITPLCVLELELLLIMTCQAGLRYGTGGDGSQDEKYAVMTVSEPLNFLQVAP
jgi:hypothetical protein